MPKKLTTQKFIEKAREVHGDNYLYDKVEYVDYRTPVTITCKIHGDFYPWPSTFIKGSGCKFCNAKNGQETTSKKAAESFIPRAKTKHGDKYDYSKFVYEDSRTKSTIICPIHGEFLQNTANHLSGKGCPKCSKESARKKLIARGLTATQNKLNTENLTEQFIKKAKTAHGERYDYSKVKYTKSTEKVEIICSKHGSFYQTAQIHLKGAGCKKCGDEQRGLNKRNKYKAEFIKSAKKIHGNKYDYSKVDYTHSSEKVIISCPKHGDFQIRPNNLLSGTGCPACGTESMVDKQRMPLEDFIAKAKKVHGDIYDYSKVDYKSYHEHITIICPEHGPFEQSPAGHLRGRGCQQCGIIKFSDALRFDTTKFIEDAKKVHGDKYDYSKVDYKESNKPVSIICPEHGEFTQSYQHHVVRKQRCPSCANRDMNTDKFIARAYEVHGDKYDYSKVDYKLAKEKVTIICPEHGEFEQVAWNHLDGIGCPFCVDFLNSSGSKKIEQWLITNGYEYEREKTFKGLYNKFKRRYKLRFDFYLPKFKLMIEFDGRQHFEPIPMWGGKESFNRLQDNDQKKNKWAEDNGYRLLRIAYFQEDQIEQILALQIGIKPSFHK